MLKTSNPNRRELKTKAKGFCLVDVPQVSMRDAENEDLSAPFEALELSDLGMAIVLPPEYLVDGSVGYLKELKEYCESVHPHFTMFKMDSSMFGASLSGEYLVLISSAKPVKINAKCVTPLRDVAPEVFRHARTKFNLNKLKAKTGVSHNFAYSQYEAAPPISSWGLDSLVVEVVKGEETSPRRLTKSEVCDLVGVTDYTGLGELVNVVPLALYAELDKQLCS
jgi:hypothetical protein